MRSGTGRRSAAVALLLVVLTAAPASAQPQPAVPSPADAATVLIAQLYAELAAPQAAVANARALAAIALDDYQAEQAALGAAQAAAQQAAATAARTETDLGAARAALVDFARRSYISGSTSPGAASLITSADPAELTLRIVLLNAAGSYRAGELARYTAARDASGRAQAAAQDALARAGDLQRQAAGALDTARTAEHTARQEATGLAGRQAGLQAQLDQARQQLVALVGEQEAARRVTRAQAAAAAPPTQPAELPPVNTRPAGPPVAPEVGAALAAARSALGTPYAWGGGGSTGPGYGLDLDAGVIGFDCSGLTQFAYAQAGIAIPRNSRAQFAALPKVARAGLQAGDLVFWAIDPRDPATIHHVALYLGDGRVLQAPESGDVVTIAPMWWAGFAGAVRPTG